MVETGIQQAAHHWVLAQEVEHPKRQDSAQYSLTSTYDLLFPQSERHRSNDGAEQHQLGHEQAKTYYLHVSMESQEALNIQV
jgi:hypothetical protein